MKEIYCKAGKMTVQLPDEAWEEFGPGVSITPCVGCGHKFHKERLEFMEKEAGQAALVNLETTLTNEHRVNVVKTFITGNSEEVVMCTCNCTIRFPTYGPKRSFNIIPDMSRERVTDEESWGRLVQDKLTEARSKGLYPRFLHGKENSWCGYTIVPQKGYIVVFSYLSLDDDENLSPDDRPTQQAIILEKDKKPIYAFQIQALKNLGKYWTISNEKEGLNPIAFAFYYLDKSKIFSAEKGTLWKAPTPDITGVMEALRNKKEESKS